MFVLFMETCLFKGQNPWWLRVTRNYEKYDWNFQPMKSAHVVAALDDWEVFNFPAAIILEIESYAWDLVELYCRKKITFIGPNDSRLLYLQI